MSGVQVIDEKVTRDRSARPASAAILKPYSQDPDNKSNRFRRNLVTVGAAVFCFFYGSFFALFAPYLILGFVFPLMVLGALIIWALPETTRAPIWAIEPLWIAYFTVLVLWPNYMALAFPGLPWITPERLINLPLFVVLLTCVSTSKPFRVQISETFKASRAVTIMLGLFVFIQFYSIFLSEEKFFSLNKFLTAQTEWTAVCIVSAFVFLKPGRVEKWAYLLWGMAIITGLIGIFEFRAQRVLWAGFIPKFLQIQDPGLQLVMAGVKRAYTGIYRTQSTFGTALDFAEFIGLTMPFVYNFAFGSYGPRTRAAALISIPYLAFVSYITGARSGPTAVFVATLIYLLYWGVRRWQRMPRGLIGPLVVISYPVLGIAALSSVFFVGKVHKLILGGGAQHNSNDSRVQQYTMGIPKVLENPFGHGIGMAADTLGWRLPNGMESIDTLYLSTALEYGVLGFLVFFGMILYCAGSAAWISFSQRTEDREITFLSSAAIALVNFVIIRAVFSQQSNIPIVFALIGMVVALTFRARSLAASRRAPPRPEANGAATAPATRRMSVAARRA